MITNIFSMRQAIQQAHQGLGKAAAVPTLTEHKPEAVGAAEGRRTLLFIHGVDYCNPDDVNREFVEPILTGFGAKYVAKNFASVASLSWNSLLLQEPMRSELYRTPLKKIMTFAVTRSSWPKFFADAERRAVEAARFLTERYSEDDLKNMTVVTHSLGSLVWAKTLQFFIERRGLNFSPGTWINLQPALPMDCFTEAGIFSSLPRLYRRCAFSRHEIWHSKEDFVLRLIYPHARKSLALGQHGCPEKSFAHRDVTSLAREAHGVSAVRQKAGNFFQRITPIIEKFMEPLAGNDPATPNLRNWCSTD